ncbi:ArnT family glycosyltransferase [Patescibacteria group bacterium]
MKKSQYILLIILALNILLRIPGLFDPVSYGDECIYLTLGQGFNKGLVFYRDIHDNKPPLLYLVAALSGGTQFWFRLITIVWNSINVYIIYLLAKKLLKKETVGLVAAALFAYFSLLPEGRVANAEIFFIMPATLGVLTAFKALEKKKVFYWFLSGLLFALAFLFKIPVAFDYVGLVLAFFVFSYLNKAVEKKSFNPIFKILTDKNFYLNLAGFIIPIIFSIGYYAIKGAFTPYVRSALMQNIGYLSSWGGDNSGLYIRAAILLFISFIIFILRKKLKFPFVVFSLLGFWSLYGVYLSERPYPHYYMEIVPWAAMLLTIFIFQRKVFQLLIILLFLATIRIGYVKYNFWWYHHLPYYKNFSQFALGKINKDEYFKFFGDKVTNDYKVAKYLKINTDDKDNVFIWGDGVCIYSLSRKLPPGRYTVNYHIFDFNGFEETLKAIEDKQPKFIIKLTSEHRKFPQLDDLLIKGYKRVEKIGEAIIYKKIN